MNQPTIASRVKERASHTPAQVAMREKRFGIWQEITWADYWDQVETVAHGYLALGVGVGDRVAIQSENRPEWLFADVAAVASRAVSVGLYPTNPIAEVSYILRHCGAKVLIAEDQEQVDKALTALPDLVDLERIVYVEPRGIQARYSHPRLMSWTDFLELGRRHRSEHSGAVAELMGHAQSHDLVALMYTSGTTGPPKGVMLSVANVEYAVETAVYGGGLTSPPPSESDLLLSYLPLCHVVERIFTTWFNAGAGTQVNFAESIETVPANLREVQPTILFGVPRIWEKVAAGIEIRIASASRIKQSFTRFWLRRAANLGEALVRSGGQHTLRTRMAYGIGWLLCYRALQDRLGLRRVRWAGSGAAPIAPDVLAFFMGIGIPMHEAYGMTENAGIATANRPGRVKVGTVGEPQPGVEVRIDERTGEILTRHPGVFVGYWNDPDATSAVLEPDGWLHTGDVGTWVGETHVKVTDRMKDIIITAGGKNIAPSELENALKASPYVKEAIVIGDRRRYVTALIGIELDTVGEWAQHRRIPYTTYRDLSERQEVRELVAGVIGAVNERFARVEQIKDFRMLPKELDHEDGELTATQKVRRSAIGTAFGDLVESMYAGAAAGAGR